MCKKGDDDVRVYIQYTYILTLALGNPSFQFQV